MRIVRKDHVVCQIFLRIAFDYLPGTGSIILIACDPICQSAIQEAFPELDMRSVPSASSGKFAVVKFAMINSSAFGTKIFGEV